MFGDASALHVGVVPHRRQPFPRHFVRERRHIADPGDVDPRVVKAKERVNGDRIVQRFVRPPGLAGSIDVGLLDGGRIGVRLFDEPVKDTILLGDRCGLDIVQDSLDERAISKQLRRDRGVRANSERTIVEPRCERGDQLSLAGRKGRRAAHDLLREAREMVSTLWLERKQMQNLRNGDSRGSHLRESFSTLSGR